MADLLVTIDFEGDERQHTGWKRLWFRLQVGEVLLKAAAVGETRDLVEIDEAIVFFGQGTSGLTRLGQGVVNLPPFGFRVWKPAPQQ